MPHTTHRTASPKGSRRLSKLARATSVCAATVGLVAMAPATNSVAAPSTHDPRGGLSAFVQTGNHVTMRGVAYDPDTMPHGTAVYVYLNGRLATSTTSLALSYQWAKDMVLPAGQYAIRVDALNQGTGSTTTLLNHSVIIPGSVPGHDPRGGLFGYAQAGNHVLLSGVAYDPDTMPHGTGVYVYLNGRLATSTTSQALSYRWGKDMVLPAGRYLVQVVALNAGVGANVTMLNWWVTIPSAAAAVQTSGGNQQIAASLLASYGWGADQLAPLVSLWNRESGWNPHAANSSGAYGIPQALPGSKMASAGADWASNPATQIRWGLSYIKGVYGSPAAAWAHSQATNWY